MSKKDYAKIAEVVKDTYEKEKQNDSAVSYSYCIALRLANVMAEDNPRFDRGRFLKACGID